MHSNCKLLFDRYVRKCFSSSMQVLEIGPDGAPSTFQNLIGDTTITWHTLDIRWTNPWLTFVATNEYQFPIADASYDLVLSANVMEHVRKPWVWIREIARVCRAGAAVITISPVSWPYHEAPIDCWRVYPEGLRALYEEAGLAVELCLWESLESPGYRRYLPGMSLEMMTPRRRLANQVLGSLGMPVERSYDALTIGRKGPA